jgi:hypothetical protein
MITEKDLKLEYLRDTGNQIENSIEKQIEIEHIPNDVNLKIECPECEAIFYEVAIPDTCVTREEVFIDCIDENYHNWCIEKLLEFKNKVYENKESILPEKQ